MKCTLFNFILAATFFWFLPFVFRLVFINDLNVYEINHTELTTNLFEKLSDIYEKGDKYELFFEIFFNNLKSCVFNIVGGVMFGLGTLINLLMNGFVTADMLHNSYQKGLPVTLIIKHTLPHSIELLGVWLSGAIGFYIARQLWNFIRHGKINMFLFFKIVGANFFATVIIILVAAFLEVYVSLP